MARRNLGRRKPHDSRRGVDASSPGSLRIVGGRFRGRRLTYSGDQRTRPMKDRVRQAMFDLLGPSVRATHAIDLFGGTGALALEAISRGAQRATIIERHVPTARLIQSNAASLGATEQTEIVAADAFWWAKMTTHNLTLPWTVFCSPPYRFYHDQTEQILELIRWFTRHAPPGSNFVVESDTEFNPALLPQAERWTVRDHPPARLAVCRDAGSQED